MQFPQRINNGKVSVGRERRQCEHTNANADILSRLADPAHGGSPWPRLHRVDNGREWDAGDDYQQVGQREGEDVPGEKMEVTRQFLA